MQNSILRGVRERWTFRGYLISETDDNRWAVEVGGIGGVIADFPSLERAKQMIDYRENNASRLHVDAPRVPEGVADTLERVAVDIRKRDHIANPWR